MDVSAITDFTLATFLLFLLLLGQSLLLVRAGDLALGLLVLIFPNVKHNVLIKGTSSEKAGIRYRTFSLFNSSSSLALCFRHSAMYSLSCSSRSLLFCSCLWMFNGGLLVTRYPITCPLTIVLELNVIPDATDRQNGVADIPLALSRKRSPLFLPRGWVRTGVHGGAIERSHGALLTSTHLHKLDILARFPEGGRSEKKSNSL